MLYIIPTPIGNLDDISKRAIEILKKIDLIACEDTRHTLKLLNHYNIKKPLISYHQHSKLKKIDYIISELENEKNIAMVSDAGTPSISDPGHILVKKAIEKNIKIISVPGASALVTALAASGFNLSSFIFLGFLPHKKGRQTILKKIKKENSIFVFYESTHRIIKLFKELDSIGLDKKICLAKELSKIHENFIRGSAKNILNILEKNPDKQKGEFVVIVNKN